MKTDLERVVEIFHEPDLSIIKEVIYFDGWYSYEECGGYLIFRGIDDSIQCCNYGSCIFAEDNTNYFEPREITAEKALEMLKEMENYKNED